MAFLVFAGIIMGDGTMIVHMLDQALGGVPLPPPVVVNIGIGIGVK